MGRWVRTEKLFVEDKIMCWAIIPLMVRMAFVHVVLIWGTNNTITVGLSHTEILHRETGSKLVLAARIIYAAFIWMTKLSILEFLKRTTTTTWSRTYNFILRFTYGFLLLTFVAIIIGTLTECTPFPHYWQVTPDPGPQCREGLVQLIIMGVCDIVTDVVLIAFPIPVVLRSSMPFRKKFSMIILFCLSAILIAITSYRIPSTIDRKADQPYRSLLASLEILAATGVSNAVIIGSFIRDKGVKKAKFRAASIGDADSSIGTGNGLQRVMTARSAAVTLNHWGSDEDLVRDLGVALPSTLRHGSTVKQARAPTAAPPYQAPEGDNRHEHSHSPSKPFHGRRSSQFDPTFSFAILRAPGASLDEPVSPGADLDTEPLSKQMSFFDVGGLVDAPKTKLRHSQPGARNQTTDSHTADSGSPAPGARGRTGSKAFLSDIGGILGRHKEEDESESGTPKSTSRSLTPSRIVERRRASRSPNPVKRLQEAERKGAASATERSPRVQPTDQGPDSLSFGDIGGLLSR
ncbi:uncharacterized protein HMPREF1541_03338 [Cyphellophora europaea CBS 101466]|uniref:Rhodopsin domain-containing protein n=1 Tax=Cyphellophora europaea (strain CBS 101466) TaxID=1220924 RepID=W2S060_CYPE1|nr:uncharacterized protein HMPREF1541_03338 [Cyphellophora europaea CBS 101466]ETN41403.1 hypothetical protein HMPREF1541_03338 [Cyphellophora europaea CBS 101466]